MPTPEVPSAMSDERLVSASLDGRKDHFGALVERYWRMAVALSLARIEDMAQAEEVAQDSFVRAYENLRSLRDPSCFAGWLRRIVEQKCVDCVRRASRHEHVSLSAVLETQEEPVAAAALDPELTNEQRQTIRSAVGRLPEKYRAVVVMRFVGNMSTDEIARQLRMRAGTVRVRLHRAYQTLRRDLGSLSEEVTGR